MGIKRVSKRIIENLKREKSRKWRKQRIWDRSSKKIWSSSGLKTWTTLYERIPVLTDVYLNRHGIQRSRTCIFLSRLSLSQQPLFVFDWYFYQVDLLVEFFYLPCDFASMFRDLTFFFFFFSRFIHIFLGFHRRFDTPVSTTTILIQNRWDYFIICIYF